MEEFLKSVLSKSNRSANFYGAYFSWAALLIGFISLIIMSYRHEDEVPLIVWLMGSLVFVVILSTNLYLIYKKGESRIVRFIWILVMLLIAHYHSIVLHHAQWAFFLLPVFFSIYYNRPRFTLCTGLFAAVWAYGWSFLQMMVAYHHGLANMQYVFLNDPMTIDLRQGFFGVCGPIIESGQVSLQQIQLEYALQELPMFLLLLGFSAVSMILVRKFSHRMQIKLDNLKQSQTILEQKLREEAHTRQIEEVKALNQELKNQRELASEAKRLAEAANETKTEFVNLLSHEIRTSMNAIVGFTALAGKSNNDVTIINDYLSKISHSSQYLLSLINEVYDMNLIDSGQLTLMEQDVRITDVIKDLHNIIASAASAKSVDFEIDTTGIKDEIIKCDPIRLNQAFINLMSTALRYSSKGDHLRMELYQQTTEDPNISCYEFKLVGEGSKIEPDMASKLFANVKNLSTTSEVSGVKINLSTIIAKQIIEEMGGNVMLIAEEGKPKICVVRLYLKNVDANNNETPEHDASQFNPDGISVLVAEDNELNQEIITTQLESAGFRVDVVDDGLEAVSKIMNSPAGTYSVILMDCVMPRMNGYDATQIIRSIPDVIKSQIPIIAISANALENDRRAAIEAGMNAHIAKPISLDVLMQELAKILR